MAAALPLWHRAFARLVDDDRTETRLAAAEANAAICAGAGRGLAAHLKRVAPAWFAAAHDEDATVAAAASASFARVFATEERRRAVLTRFAGEVLGRVAEKLAGEGDAFGARASRDDAGGEGSAEAPSEARRERSERTRAAALRTLAGFVRAADTSSRDVFAEIVRALDAIPGGLRKCAASPSAQTRRAAYGAALALAGADGVFGETDEATDEAPLAKEKRRSAFAAVALLDATDETDGSSLGEARELTLGFLNLRGDAAWEDLAAFLETDGVSAATDRKKKRFDSIDAFLGSLERHVSSGCHGAAEASAPSVLPLLAALPRGALVEKDRLRRLLASLWEGYRLCNVPSRSADAAALLGAFREATLYGAIVVAEEGGDDVDASVATRAEAFRAELFRCAFLERWVPESLLSANPNRGENDAATASLCECLVGVSRRPTLSETCLRATMERVAADCARMVAGSSPGGGVDAAGARRVAAFHAALCAAAETRDASDEKKRGLAENGSDAKVPERRDTAKRWVERAFARPVAVATAAAVASEPTEAGAALLASLVERHGASCLTPADASSDDARREAASSSSPASSGAVSARAVDSLLDACFERNRHANGEEAGRPDTNTALSSQSTSEKARARARTLAALVFSAPGTWDDALRRASESARRGDASGLATVAAALEILGEKSKAADASASASSSRSWRRPALDAIVVDAATAKDARERLGAEAAALVSAAAATASVTPEAAAVIARNLASAVAGAAVASDAARDAVDAAEAWAWPPPPPDAGADAADAYARLVAALFGARLDEESLASEDEDEGDDEDEGEGSYERSGSESAGSESSGSEDESEKSAASLSGSEPESLLDDARATTRPASATWARVERAAARGGHASVAQVEDEVASAPDAEAAARAAFVAETARRLSRLEELSRDGDERRTKRSVAAARRLAGAAASALAAFGAGADDAAASAASAALVDVSKAFLTTKAQPSEPSACYLSPLSVCRVAFLGGLESLFGSWEPFLAAAAAADARAGAAPGAAAARLLAAHSARFGTAAARAAARTVVGAFASALASTPVRQETFEMEDMETFRREDPFASAAGALVRDAVARGVAFFGARPQPVLEAALAALRANARVRPPSAASRARARAALADAVAAAAKKTDDPAWSPSTTRALARVVPLTRVDDADAGETAADAAFDAFAASCAANARASLSTETLTRDDPLGPAVALAAACYSRDAARSARARGGAAAAARLASGERIVFEKTDGSRAERAPAALLELVRAATRREAASAAAARFAKLQTPNRDETNDENATAATGPAQPGPEPADSDADRALAEEERADAFARLSVAAVERCGAEMDARDWELIIDRLRRLFKTRVASGEDEAERASCAEGPVTDPRGADGDPRVSAPRREPAAGSTDPPAGWRAAAAGARLLLRLESLPVVVAPPDPGTSSEGDVVPFGAQGEAARTLALHLARASWPSARAEAHASLARALMAAGAERLHTRAEPLGERRWRRRRGAEAGLWADAAALWSTASGAAAVAAAAPWDAMDQWEEAGCGAVAALYETLLCADEEETDDPTNDPFEDTPPPSDETEDIRLDEDEETRRRDSACLAALRRASYALLSSPSLVKPAVVGFDCAVADVEAVEEAALEADSEDVDVDGDDGEGDGGKRKDVARLADRAALREPLANKLLRERGLRADGESARTVALRDGRGRGRDAPVLTWRERDVSTTLCWALFLKHLGGGVTGPNADANGKADARERSEAARERLAAFARDADAVADIMRLALRSLPLTPTAANKPTRRHKRGTNPRDGSALNALPRVWRDAAGAARDAARDGGGGGGAAAAAAAADALSPSFLFGSGVLKHEKERLALGAYRACLVALPALTRTWFSDLKDVPTARALSHATATAVSPFLLEREFDAVERAASKNGFADGDADSAGDLTVRVSRGAGEISATYALDDAAVELKVRLPKTYPLVAAELETGARAGVSEARARKWRLAVGAILRRQNGAVADGLRTWRRNVDREFAGVEPCPICYLVIHGSNHQLPRLRCGQCRNTFHNACLYKWFASSSKSTCPLCQTPWGASYRG